MGSVHKTRQDEVQGAYLDSWSRSQIHDAIPVAKDSGLNSGLVCACLWGDPPVELF